MLTCGRDHALVEDLDALQDRGPGLQERVDDQAHLGGSLQLARDDLVGAASKAAHLRAEQDAERAQQPSASERRWLI
jgi:hypothetical protein